MLPDEDWNRVRLVIAGVTVSVIAGFGDVQVIIEGDMPADLAARVVEEMRAKAETAVQNQCILERL